MKRLIIPLLAGVAIAGCNKDQADQAASDAAAPAPEVSFEPGQATARDTKPKGPVQIAYRIIGSPIVGQPVAVELEITSNVESTDVTLSYRVNDTTALQIPEAQPATVTLAAARREAPPVREQVQVIPLREGRLYLNVSATVETKNGSLSTVSAIPIQVGAATPAPPENGALDTDENGDAIRVLEGKD
ncbi:MAG: hypothetical protein WB812_12415 [Woeseiaceae bacterium]